MKRLILILSFVVSILNGQDLLFGNFASQANDTSLIGKILINFAPSSHTYTGDGTWNNHTSVSQNAFITLIDSANKTSTSITLTNITAISATYTNGDAVTGYPDSVAVSQFGKFDFLTVDTLRFANITDDYWKITINGQRSGTGDRTTRFIMNGVDSVLIDMYGNGWGEIESGVTNGTVDLWIRQITGEYSFLNFMIIERYDIQ